MNAETLESAAADKVKHVSRLQGTVVSNGMDKTIVVKVIRTLKHPRYKKIIKQTTKIMAHDPNNQCVLGDLVDIVESRPHSKRKSWMLEKVVKSNAE